MRLGLGKIHCHETEKDVVISVVDLTGFDIGDEVTFLIKTDDFGTPRACKLRPVGGLSDDDDDEEEAVEEDGQDEEEVEVDQDNEEPEQLDYEKYDEEEEEVPEEPAQPVRRQPAPVDIEPGTRLTGTIKGINKKLGLGGITCTETGRLVKVMIAELAGFEAGDSVSFDWGKDGLAKNVEAC